MTWQIAFFLLFIGHGAGIIVYSVLALVFALESRRWPVAEGVMISARLNGPFGDGFPYRLRVSYQFTVQGKELVGRRAYFGDSIYSKWAWWFSDRIERKYPSGTRVKVHYNPRRPEDAVLEPGLNGFIITFLLSGTALFAIGILGLRAVL